MLKVSVIIPVFNEEKSIINCIESMFVQSYSNLEIIVVDDGSTDNTLDILSNLKPQKLNFKLFEQKHLGPGMARNLGAEKASGNILVFVDADMTFDKRFIEKLVEPIIAGKTVGTFSKEEFVSNKGNFWSKCWNINKGLPIDRMHTKDYPDKQKVFRAIRKSEFERSGGFKPIGYIDDYTISDKLGVLAVAAPGAVFYHRNPETLEEIYKQARWVGKSEYKERKIKNENLMRIVCLFRYSFPFSLVKGIIGATKNKLVGYVFFKIIYDFIIEISLIGSFFGEQKYK